MGVRVARGGTVEVPENHRDSVGAVISAMISFSPPYSEGLSGISASPTSRLRVRYGESSCRAAQPGRLVRDGLAVALSDVLRRGGKPAQPAEAS